MTARRETLALMQQFSARGISLSFDEVNTLRRAELTLQRWSELECGDSNVCGSWVIERGDVGDGDGIPYMVHHRFDNGIFTRTRIADREAGALRRVAAICQAHGLHFYHQTDPRGCALYVSNEPLPDNNYSRGIACCA